MLRERLNPLPAVLNWMVTADVDHSAAGGLCMQSMAVDQASASSLSFLALFALVVFFFSAALPLLAAAFLAADSSPPFDMRAARVSLTSFKFWCLDAELIGVWYLESLACFACLALTGKALSRTHARNPRSISIRLSWLLF